MNMDELRKSLNNRVLEITFKKKNGDVRVMKCTTKLDLVPPSAWPNNNDTVLEDADNRRQVRVYDVTAQGWRSFIFDNLIEVKNVV